MHRDKIMEAIIKDLPSKTYKLKDGSTVIRRGRVTVAKFPPEPPDAEERRQEAWKGLMGTKRKARSRR